MRAAICSVLVAELCRVCALPDGVPSATCEVSTGGTANIGLGLIQGSTLVARKVLITSPQTDLITSPQTDSIQQYSQTAAQSEPQTDVSRSVIPLGLQGFWRRITPAQRVGLVLVCIALLGLKLAILCWVCSKFGSAGPSAAPDHFASLERAREVALAKLEGLDAQLSLARREMAAKAAADDEEAANPACSSQVAANAAASEALPDEAGAAVIAKADGVRERLADVSGKAGALRVEDVSAKADDLQKTLTVAFNDVRGSAETFAEQTAKATSDALHEAITAELPELEVAEFRRTTREAAAPLLGMPMPLLFAGLIAPVQIQAICSFNWIMICLQLPSFALLSVAAAANYGQTCGDGTLWTWSLGMIWVLGVNLVLRAWVLLGARTAMQHIQDHQKPSSLHGHLAGHQHASKIEGIMRLVSSSPGDYFRALLSYDQMVGTWAQTGLDLLCIASLLWGLCGIVAITLFGLDEEEHCDATMMRLAAHVYGFIYIAFILWSVLALILWVVLATLTNEKAALSALRGATAFDESYSPSSLPVASVVLQGTFLRNPSDTEALKTAKLLSDITDLRRQKEALDAQGTCIDGDLSSFELQLRAAQARSQNERSPRDVAARFSRDITSAIDSAAFAGMALKCQLRANEADMARMSGSAASMISDAEDQAARRVQEEESKRQLGEVNLNGARQKARAAAEELALSALARAKAQGVDLERLSGDFSRCSSRGVGLARAAAGAREAAPGG